MLICSAGTDTHALPFVIVSGMTHRRLYIYISLAVFRSGDSYVCQTIHEPITDRVTVVLRHVLVIAVP